MSIDLKSLSPSALRAAMTTGVESWGEWGHSEVHRRYVEPTEGRRRRCGCGCRQPATHAGMANGVALAQGCELSMRRWARDGV